MTNWNDAIMEEFHANNGKVGGNFANAKLLILGTTGAKSGVPRVSPMMYFAEPDGIYVIASKGGAPENPAWYHNLVAHPDVTVEQATDDGIDSYDAVASPVTGARHDELYSRFAQKAPGFGEYQLKTSRIIPIVQLRRKE